MRLRRPLLLASTVLLITAGIALAGPVKLTSTLLARGTWDRSDRTEFLAALAGQGRLDSSDVAVVKATLGTANPSDPSDAGPGMTGWHRHTGPSVVVVTSGSLDVYMPSADGGCMTHSVGTGQAFFHTTGTHNFVNNGDSIAEFYVTYFAPAGALLVPADDPGTCPVQ